MTRTTQWMLTGALALAGVAAFAKIPKVPQTEPDPRYNVETVIDFWATVTDVRKAPINQPLEGLHLNAKTDYGTMDIYLGPSDFVEMFGIAFAKRDTIHVVGSLIRFDGADVVLAREVTRKDSTLFLRDAFGGPLWNVWAVSEESNPRRAHQGR